MARCPLCSGRPGKRYCPAKEVQICAVCCGTKREIEIECPGSCPHLQAGRSYESEKRLPEAQVTARLQQFDNAFIERTSWVLDAISRSVLEERLSSAWLVDTDVIEAYNSLAATMKTLSSGIYYESLPEGPVRLALFRRVKAVLDELLQPDPARARPTLKVSDAVETLEFLALAAEMNSSGRPRSRQYLDWLVTMFASRQAAQPSGLILP
jgi:hypothetical protein